MAQFHTMTMTPAEARQHIARQLRRAEGLARVGRAQKHRRFHEGEAVAYREALVAIDIVTRSQAGEYLVELRSVDEILTELDAAGVLR